MLLVIPGSASSCIHRAICAPRHPSAGAHGIRNIAEPANTCTADDKPACIYRGCWELYLQLVKHLSLMVRGSFQRRAGCICQHQRQSKCVAYGQATIGGGATCSQPLRPSLPCARPRQQRLQLQRLDGGRWCNATSPAIAPLLRQQLAPCAGAYAYPHLCGGVCGAFA